MQLLFGDNPDPEVIKSLTDDSGNEFKRRYNKTLVEFLEWTAKYQKSYATKEEFADRFNNFKANQMNLEYNMKKEQLEGTPVTQEYELGKFADMSDVQY